MLHVHVRLLCVLCVCVLWQLDEDALRSMLDRLFVKECLELLSMPSTSALLTCTTAGTLALPRLAPRF